jgi:hypothetical protein
MRPKSDFEDIRLVGELRRSSVFVGDAFTHGELMSFFRAKACSEPVFSGGALNDVEGVSGLGSASL